jgi:hypothetical protein
MEGAVTKKKEGAVVEGEVTTCKIQYPNARNLGQFGPDTLLLLPIETRRNPQGVPTRNEGCADSPQC